MALGVLPASAAPVPAIHECCVGVGSTPSVSTLPFYSLRLCLRINSFVLIV